MKNMNAHIYQTKILLLRKSKTQNSPGITLIRAPSKSQAFRIKEANIDDNKMYFNNWDHQKILSKKYYQ